MTTLQAAMGACLAVAIGLEYVTRPASLSGSSATIIIGGLGALALLYYGSIHQLLRKHQEGLSAAVLSLITLTNIMYIIAISGGLDSPYFSLWLLAIVIAGFFSVRATLAILSLTILYFIYDAYAHHFAGPYIVDHLGLYGVSVVTAAIGEWIHVSLGRSHVQRQQVSELSGQLSQESLKSEALMQSVGEGVVVVDSNRLIQLFNPAAVNITGWDLETAQNIDYQLVLNLHNADGTKITPDKDPFAQCWREGKSIVRNDLIVETKGGRKIAVSLSLSPIFDANHAVTGGIALFRDISTEKEVARQRDEFISTASHEMRTPVAAIEGYLSLSMNPAVATIDVRAKGYLEKAHTSTQHLGALFRDLLSITKLEDSGKVDKLEVFDLTKLIQETVSDMQFSAEKKGLELTFGPAGDVVRREKTVIPVFIVKGNPQRLREVVMNLIENALKFTPEGRVGVTIGGTNDAVTVSVVDSGIGIAPEDAKHLFQKFYRIDSSATRTIGGTGLGLYLCRTIIELIGGRIWVDSTQGEGSAFRFTLPRLSADAAQENAAPVQTTTLSNPVTSPVPALSPQPAPSPVAVPIAEPAAPIAAANPVTPSVTPSAEAPTSTP